MKRVARLGSAAYDIGDFAWAYSLLREAVRQLPNDPKVLGKLAWASYSQGKTQEAQSAMRRLLEARPDAAQSKDATTFLAMTTLDQEDLNLDTAQTEVERPQRDSELRACVNDPCSNTDSTQSA